MKLLLENWREYVNENFLYHATYVPLLDSIRKNGLGATSRPNWEDSHKGVVYLAKTPEVAESYAETSEAAPEEWLDQIVILKIDKSRLNPDRLFADQNVIDGHDTLEYHGIIPPENIE